MRALTALALYVYVAGFAAAASPETDWATIHKQGVDAMQPGDYEKAADLFRRCVAMAENPMQKGIAENDLGLALHRMARNTEAAAQLRAAMETWKSLPGEEDKLAETTRSLSTVYRTLGDYAASEKVLCVALETPSQSPDLQARLWNELGDTLRVTGRTIEARAAFRKVMALQRPSGRLVVDAMLGLADLERDARQWEASVSLWTRAEEKAREQNWHAVQAAADRGMGLTYLEMGETARAEPLLKRALNAFEGMGADQEQISYALSCMGQLYLMQGKLAMAENAFLRSMAMAEKGLTPDHPQLAVILALLSQTAAMRGHYEMARQYFERAYNIMVARFGENSALAACVRATWARIEMGANHKAEALVDYEKALAVLDNAGAGADGIRMIVYQQYAAVGKGRRKKPAAPADSFRPGPAAAGVMAGMR